MKFGKTDEALMADRQELLTEIRGLRRDLQDTRTERDGLREQTRLTDEVTDLKKQVVDQEIRRSKLTEDHEREKREVKHMVGLEKKRQQFEIDQARRETTVSVREENLAADRKRFEDQMKFTTERFQSEVGYLKDLMGEVLDRLPTITVDKTVTDIRRRKTADGE